jgi:hypothetical protein
VPTGNVGVVPQLCPSGDVATGGGGSFATGLTGVSIVQNQPYPTSGTPAGWQVAYVNQSGTTQTVNTYAICAPAANGATAAALAKTNSATSAADHITVTSLTR